MDFSAQYAAMEDQFINIAKDGKDYTYKMLGAEKVCLDNFMFARNNKLLFSKGSMDANGKTTLHDELGRPLIAPEGEILPLYLVINIDKNLNSVNPEMGIPSQA